MFSANNSQAVAAANYIEDVFSTYLYTGNGSTQTITNGIDLAGKGGLVWIKSRSLGTAGYEHILTDTVKGTNSQLNSASTAAATAYTNALTAFNSAGFSLGARTPVNASPETYASWTFRKQPKFFDIQTYNTAAWYGDNLPRTLSHNLGSTPGMVIVKIVSGGNSNWYVWHRDLGNGYALFMNTTDAKNGPDAGWWNNTAPTSTTFTIGTYLTQWTNATFVVYLFAHNAGGFGLTGTDNVISCGSVGSNPTTVNLGWEPQWLLIKPTESPSSWYLMDNMRGTFVDSSGQGYVNFLAPNSSSAENAGNYIAGINSTGFTWTFTSPAIYIAIRRGPMKTPTSGTSVFSPIAVNNATGTANTTGFPVDMQIQFYRPGNISYGTSQLIDRLRGISSTSSVSGQRLYPSSTNIEEANAIGTLFNNTGWSTGSGWNSSSMAYWNFRRAPGFFDVVCYTGTGVARTVTHNLGVAPELMIVKDRTTAGNWPVYSAAYPATQRGLLNQTGGWTTQSLFDTAPTASVFSVTSYANYSAENYVAYLFASCPGVSKVGSYTGTGTTLQVNCGFTGGARFVLIKRTDSTGDWYVWDSARGIVAGNDPYLLLNSTAAEVTTTAYIDTYSAGFEISSTAPAAINASGGTYIYLAIA